MCTSLTLSTANKLNSLSRTMDFDFILDPELIIMPRNYPLASEIDEITRSVKYAFVGPGRYLDSYSFADGVNEVGLACATLYFPGYAHYSNESIPNKVNIAPHEVVGWLLSHFKTIDEIKNAISELNIIHTPVKLFNIVTPLHWLVTDQSGKTIVIEPMADGIVIHDNPLGVMANSPDFNWHLTNIRNYIGVNPHILNAIQLNGLTFEPFGNGARTVGLPGDYTPPSRFLRVLFGKEVINELDNEDECVKAAFHILSSVEIPKGSVLTTQGIDYTQYSSCMICNTSTYYIKTYDNNQIIQVKLFNEDLDAKEPNLLKLPQEQHYASLN